MLSGSLIYMFAGFSFCYFIVLMKNDCLAVHIIAKNLKLSAIKPEFTVYILLPSGSLKRERIITKQCE